MTPRSVTRSTWRLVWRGVVGSVPAVLLVPALLVALLAAPVTSTPSRAAADWIARRLTWIDGRPRRGHPPGRRLLALLGVESILGLVGGYVLVLIGAGLVVGINLLYGAATGAAVPALDAPDPGRITWGTVTWVIIPGLILLFLAVCGLAGIGWLDRQAWAALSRPGVGELEQQVQRLHTTLDDVIEAVDNERRRIERDLHDGVQQRVVALSILLARADRTDDPIRQGELRRQAREETQHVLDDLRTVAWRIHPAMLARDGLAAALEAMRDRTPIPIHLEVDGDQTLDKDVAAAAYFVVSEAVTNVIKHAEASRIDIRVTHGDDLGVTVRDDGVGGADPDGQGLTGIASRVAVRGGRLRVHSPSGGPTTIEANFPCG